MTKKLSKVVLAFFLFVTAIFWAFPQRGNAFAENGKSRDENVTIWSALSTTKVLRDLEYDMSDEAVLRYEMCKNEVEGAQFIITPASGYEVGSFTVEISELNGPNGAKIEKDDISVYLQKYINVYINATGNPNKRTGYHPDALLPFDKAVEYGENKVEGKNQAVYVTVETQETTPAGEYTGSASVTIDGEAYAVPVQVTVWDFAISEETHVKSLFAIWDDQLMYTELDSSKEMRQAYIDALAEYRLSPDQLAYESIEEYVEKAKAATKNPAITCYMLPYRSTINTDPELSLGGTLDFAYHKQYLKALALASTEECCLIDKLVYYPGALYDEPQFDASGNMNKQIIYVANKLDELEEELFAELEREGYFDGKSTEYKEHFRETLTNIPNLVTGPYNEDYPDGVTYCPLFDQFDTQENRAEFTDAKERNGEVWWYGCTGPNYPYVTYHVDDSLVGARILNWMMYDYGIDGNLYWAVNYNLKAGTEAGDIGRPVDAYEEVRRSSVEGAINGDGYLFYPGVDYGIYGPVGSIRLEMIRDGIEEYEYLYKLDELAAELSGYYKTDISANEMVSNLYKRLYTGAKYVPDEENYFAVRRELASMIERVNGPDRFVAGEITYNGATASMDFYVADGYEVQVNGETLAGSVQGNGKKFTATAALDQSSNYFNIRLTKDGNVTAYDIFISGKVTEVQDFDEVASVGAVHANDETISVSHNTDAAYAVAGGSAKVHIVSKFDPDDPFETLTYFPEITFDANELGFKISELDQFTIMVYNASEEDINVKVYLGAPDRDYSFSTVTLRKGQWNTVTLSGIYLTNWSQLSAADRIIFRFSNTVNDENKVAMPDQILYLDNMIVAAKSE